MEEIKTDVGNGNSQEVTETEVNEEKLFTQDEVNEIVRNRLERVKLDQDRLKQLAERERQLDLRQKELSQKEDALKCQHYLEDKGYSLTLMEVLDTSDPDTFMLKADKIASIAKPSMVQPMASYEQPLHTNDLPDAFARGHKHKPRNLG